MGNQLLLLLLPSMNLLLLLLPRSMNQRLPLQILLLFHTSLLLPLPSMNLLLLLFHTILLMLLHSTKQPLLLFPMIRLLLPHPRLKATKQLHLLLPVPPHIPHLLHPARQLPTLRLHPPQLPTLRLQAGQVPPLTERDSRTDRCRWRPTPPLTPTPRRWHHSRQCQTMCQQ